MRCLCVHPLKAGTLRCAAPRPIPRCRPATSSTRPSALPEQAREAVSKAGSVMKKQAEKLHRQYSTFGSEVLSAMTPRQAGDAADWFLMLSSTVVFTLLAMQLYRIYAFLAWPHLFR